MNTPQSLPDPAVLARAAAKVKRHVLPLFVVMFIVNYIDRVNIGFVRSHLETDLGIGAAAYGLGAGLFFIGYAIFEVPSNLLLQRYGARAWLTRIMFTWGAAAMAMAFVRGETSFYVLRFILGAAEAGFFPGIIYYFTQWLPSPEDLRNFIEEAAGISKYKERRRETENRIRRTHENLARLDRARQGDGDLSQRLGHRFGDLGAGVRGTAQCQRHEPAWLAVDVPD